MKYCDHENFCVYSMYQLQKEVDVLCKLTESSVVVPNGACCIE